MKTENVGYVIARFIEGISINGYEFVLTKRGTIRRWLSPENALTFFNQECGTNYGSVLELDEAGYYIIPTTDLNPIV
jgi:hypothetical protein